MSARGWALFAAVSVLWGIPYLFIKLAVEELSPAFVAWGRVVLAAAVLLPLAWRLGALEGLRTRLGSLAAFAAAEVVVPFPLISFGEQHISSSLTAILIAALPLTVAVIAIRFDHAERATGVRLAGLLIGLAGVVALLGIDVAGEPDELLGAGAIMVAIVGYAIGPMVVKHRLADVEPLGPVAGALGLASLMLLPAAILGAPDEMPGTQAIASVTVLGLACTAVAFLFFFALIAEVGPGRATVITYVNPIIAVALGIVVLDESVTAGAVAGLLLILAGSWLSTDGRLPPGLAAIARGLRGRPTFLRRARRAEELTAPD